MPTPYAVSSDLVSAWPAKSLEVATYLDTALASKTDLAMVQNAQTGTYTMVLADQTKLVTLSNASPVAVTLPLESSVAWPTGTQLRLLNQGAGLVTVAGAVGVTINGTPLTLAQYKGAVLTKTGTNTWTFIPFSGGSAPAVISSTTGSPTITTDAGATVYAFTGDGTLVVGTGGTARVCVIGAGGGGGPVISGESGGGGGGGWMSDTTLVLTAGTYTIKVGTAGAAGVNASSGGGRGGDSYITLGDANIAAPGGGGGSYTTGTAFVVAMVGASGGGGNYQQTAGGLSVFTSGGYSGGNGASYSGGGGGGVGGAGANGVALSTTGAAGGIGKDSDILVSGTQVFYGGGGGAGKSSAGGTSGAGGSGSGGAGGTNGAGGTGVTYGGGGGGGGLTGANNGGAGKQGVVIVRIG